MNSKRMLSNSPSHKTLLTSHLQGSDMTTEIMNKLQQLTEQNLGDIEQAKAEGRSVVGFYCVYSPTEVAVAAGAIPVPLCGTRNDPIASAEEVLPRNLCPLIKSSYGFAVSDTCAFFDRRISSLATPPATAKRRCSNCFPGTRQPMCSNCPRTKIQDYPCRSGRQN